MKKRFFLLILPILALILEALPYGAVCVFAATKGNYFRQTYSYFSLIPFGYANFSPLITALLTCTVLIVLTVYCFTGKRSAATAARVLLIIGTVISLGPLVFGFAFFSLIGGLISISLLTELVLLQFFIRK